MGPRDELIFFGVVLALCIAAWYITLFQPVTAKVANIEQEMVSEHDSIAASQRYNTQTLALTAQTEQIRQQIGALDSRFPPRDSVVALAKYLINFAGERGLDLIQIQPSLFELYALEKGGAPISGRFVMHLPIRFKLEGRYLDLGRMLDDVNKLPFNLTVADMRIAVIPDRAPLIEAELEVYLYVHL